VKRVSLCTLKSKIVIHINKESDQRNIPADPNNKTHEGAPDSVTSFATEIVTAINVALAINGMDLLHLPMFMHRHSTVSL
jgi:hypothetical protein